MDLRLFYSLVTYPLEKPGESSRSSCTSHCRCGLRRPGASAVGTNPGGEKHRTWDFSLKSCLSWAYERKNMFVIVCIFILHLHLSTYWPDFNRFLEK